jgi:hypothetical protein
MKMRAEPRLLLLVYIVGGYLLLAKSGTAARRAEYGLE